MKAGMKWKIHQIRRLKRLKAENSFEGSHFFDCPFPMRMDGAALPEDRKTKRHAVRAAWLHFQKT